MVHRRVLQWLLVLCVLLASSSTGAFAQPEKAQGQERQKLVVAVIQTPPYSMQDDDGTWTGITVDLWKEIAQIIDVDYEFKQYDNLKAAMKAIYDKKADLAACGISITAAREKEFDFSDPYLSAIESIAVNSDREPNMFQVVRSTLFNSTTLMFVLVLAALAIFGASVLWLVEQKGDSEHYKGKTRKAFGRSLFWSTMVMAGREFPKATGWSTVSPETFAGRVFAIIWMFLGIALVTVLTAAAASVFTSRQLQGFIHDEDDLRHVKVGTVASSVGEEYLDHRHIKYIKPYANSQELLQALAERKIDAAVFNRHIMVYFTRKMFARQVVVLSLPLRQDFLAIPMRSGFPLKERINEAVMEVVESKKWHEIVSTYLGNEWVNASATQ